MIKVFYLSEDSSDVMLNMYLVQFHVTFQLPYYSLYIGKVLLSNVSSRLPTIHHKITAMSY